MYRSGTGLEVLLVHPGGPYWRRKDEGVWSIPKGEIDGEEDAGIREILGSPDDLKFRSSMTLFAAVSSDPAFAAAIAKYHGGVADPRTLELLGS
jgi:hypothetical protein